MKRSAQPKQELVAVNVADAKRQFSDLLGRVAYGGETVTITRRGKPMALLVPVRDADEPRHLGDVEGWLDGEDPFFKSIDEVVGARGRHVPRVVSTPRRRAAKR